MSCKWISPTGRQCSLQTGHVGNHLTSLMCRAGDPGSPHYCSRPVGHTESHRAYEGDALCDSVWPQETKPVSCTFSDGRHHCSLDVGHDGQHEAWEGHKVGPVGGCLSVWPRSTGVPADVGMATLEFCGKDPSPGRGFPPCGLVLGHGGACVSGSDDTSGFLVQLSEHITELEERHARVQLGEAGERKVLSDRIDRLKDDTRDAAAAAGEALERTKGLQVHEILRRLNGVERRINSMDGGRVASVTDIASMATLTGAVNELTTVMRELVRQNAPTEAKPIVCPATLTMGSDELQSVAVCTRLPGHPGMHQEGEEAPWLAG